MQKAVFIYPLGDLQKYSKATYEYKSEKVQTKLPVIWLAEKLEGVSKIVFVITEKSKGNYPALFEGLFKLLISEDLESHSLEELKKFRRRESFANDKKAFVEKLKSIHPFDFDFLVINEKDLTSFILELKSFIEHDSLNTTQYTIHIDITHAYRFIPMFLTTVVALLKNAGLNLQIGEILYAFGEEDENTVINLSEYQNVLEWSHAIHAFKISANIKAISTLMTPLGKDMQNRIEELQSSLDMNLAPKIKSSLLAFKEAIQRLECNNMVFNELILKELKNMFSDFVLDKSQSDFELSLSKWHLKNGRYLHGYTALIEALITKLCEVYGYDHTRRESREECKSILLSIRKENLNDKTYKDFVEKEIKSNTELEKIQKNLSVFFDCLANLRNTFAHIKDINEDSASQIYCQATDFAQDQNPRILSKSIDYYDLTLILENIERLPGLFPKERLKELSDIYKNIYKKLNRGGKDE